MSAATLKQVPFKSTSDRMITLGDLCDLTADRTALLIEIKTSHPGDIRLAGRATDILSGYRGRAALMSFDPEQTAAVLVGVCALNLALKNGTSERLSQRRLLGHV